MSREQPVDDALLPFFASVAEQSRERALAVARQQEASVSPTELLTFVVAGENFALPLRQVQEICRLEGLTALPKTGPETLGIISLRGEVVPVVDLAAVLGLGSSNVRAVQDGPSRPLRALLLLDAHGPLALHVREVRGVVRLPPQDVVPRPFGLAALHPELIAGVGRTGRGAVTLLDGPALLRHLERLP